MIWFQGVLMLSCLALFFFSRINMIRTALLLTLVRAKTPSEIEAAMKAVNDFEKHQIRAAFRCLPEIDYGR